MGVAGALSGLTACDTRFYESCPSDRIVDDWGVVDKTHAFGEYDSLYYLVNPIGNIRDTVYYNGNYTDSYYHSDPVRVMLRYTTDDSIQFNMDRLYATQINPMNLDLKIWAKAPSTKTEDKDTCTIYLRLRRDEDNGNLYRTGPDSLFKEILKKGYEIKAAATNGPSSSEPSGSQNYEFTLYTQDFDKALQLADSLNRKKSKISK